MGPKRMGLKPTGIKLGRAGEISLKDVREEALRLRGAIGTVQVHDVDGRLGNMPQHAEVMIQLEVMRKELLAMVARLDAYLLR